MGSGGITMGRIWFPIVTFLILIVQSKSQADSGNNTDLDAAIQFLKDNDRMSRMACRKLSLASWNYLTNITEETKKASMVAEKKHNDFLSDTWNNATTFAWKDFKDKDFVVYDWFNRLVTSKENLLPEDKEDLLQETIANMIDVYSRAKICNSSDPCSNPTLELEPDLLLIMTQNEDYDELKRVWTDWRDATGKQIRGSFLKYVEGSNEKATLNGFADLGEQWRDGYGENFRENVAQLWNDIRPFYLQLHAYVRRKLMDKYPGKIQPRGPIPAHILGDLYAATWAPKFNLFAPYPNVPQINITKNMIEKNMTILQMVKTSEEFFTSLGLHPMTEKFWKNSIFEKPEDREILCHPLALDFCDGEDVRIKMCTKITFDDLVIIHHEMGHIQYFLQYAQLPVVYRSGANPGFHEAIGDALALSVSTPNHMKEIGLLDELIDNRESEINFLMQMALDKIAFLPFGYLMDIWRWDVFNGSATPENMNAKWWEAKLEYQGVCPPVKRTEEDLDAASLLHVVYSVSYIRYFVSFVIQFQFHKALCKEAGFEGPLHKCDIYRSQAAGKLLSDVLNKGSAVTGNQAMSILTKGETDQMDASGILEYFRVLIDWLEEQNKGEYLGWISDDPTQCP